MPDVDRYIRYSFLIIFMLSLFPLTSAYEWEQRIDLNMITYSSTSTSWMPNTPATYLGIAEWDSSKYSNISEVYFEVQADSDYSGIPNGVGGCQVRLYDITNSTNLSESAYYVGGTVSYRRSGNITYFFNNSNIQLISQVKADASTTCYLYHATIVIVQDGNITKTRVMIPIGASTSETDTCGTPEDEITKPKKWNFSNSDFDGNINITFHTTHKTSASLSSVVLINSTSNIVTLSTANTNYTYSKSSNFTLFDDIYSVGICRFLGATSSLRNAFLVIDQTNINPLSPKTISVIQTDVDTRVEVSDTPVFDLTQRGAFNETNFEGINLNPKISCIMLQSGGGTAFCRLKQTSGSESYIFPINLSVTNVAYTHNESSLAKDTKFTTNIGFEVWDNVGGGATSLTSSRVIFYLSGLKCWSFNNINKELYIPNGCDFYWDNSKGNYAFALGDE